MDSNKVGILEIRKGESALQREVSTETREAKSINIYTYFNI